MNVPVAATAPLGAPPRDVFHGAVLRPHAPRAGWRAEVDAASIAALPGIVRLVHEQGFVGIVAASAVLARQAAARLVVRWADADADALPGATAAADPPSPGAAYTWHRPALAGDGVVVVWHHRHGARVWSTRPLPVATCREELARLLEMPVDGILIDAPAAPAGYAPDGAALAALDAVADAALLSRAAGAPVQVGIAAAAPVTLALTVRPPSDDGGTDWAFAPASAWTVRPSLARLARGTRPAMDADPVALPYGAAHWQPPARDAAPTAAGLLDLHAAQVFAQESAADEAARAAHADPLAWRLARLPAGRGRALLETLAARAGWSGQSASTPHTGRGLAWAEVDVPDPAGGAPTRVWSAWVADVTRDPQTGHVAVTRVTVGHDSESLAPAATATIRQGDASLLETARRLLPGGAAVDDWGVPAADGAPAPTTNAAGAVATADATAVPGPVRDGTLALDGVLTLPAAAAVANAIYDATGVRLRDAPFPPVALQAAGAALPAARGKRRGAWAWAAGAIGVAAGLAATLWPAKPAIAPIDAPDLSVYSLAAIERGRRIAAAGDCVVCHTAPGGQPNAGGLGLETPFGTVYSTNITPDPETGIGRWSYAAFARAMRDGVHRDGRQLYPAFPYTAFAKLTDGDLQALYGYLMSQPAVASTPPATQLPFPFSQRPLLAGWNALFHDATPYAPDTTRSAEWNRGAYLVQGAGHCGACHTPRNALGAEKTGPAYLAGGSAEGWDAPALNALARAGVPWTVDDLAGYLRTGFSARHGVAAGPMAPVIQGLAELPDSDTRAIAVYLLSLDGAATAGHATSADGGTGTVAPSASSPSDAPAAARAREQAHALERRSDGLLGGTHAAGERIYQNACAVCHEPGRGPTLFGVKPSLALNTSLQHAAPDNLLRVILDGIQAPAAEELGYMPGFRDSLDDRQIGELADYLRARFAPAAPAWTDTAGRATELRQEHGAETASR